jgi:PAS domain S-box-containing protein
VMDEKLIERTRIHLEEQKQLLSAALAAPLAQWDRGKAHEVLDRARREQGIVYLVLYDRKGRVVATSGWDNRTPLPPREALLKARGGGDVFHTDVDVRIGGERYGRLALGLETGFLKTARMQLIRDNLAIGLIALILSTALMVALSYWLTRNLTKLSAASAQLAAGDFGVRLPVRGGDEVAQLTHAFNTMAEALAGRIKALADSEAKFTAIADYSYDCELWISPKGKLIWINPRVQDMFGYTPEQCLMMENFPAPFIGAGDTARTMREIRKALRGNTGHDFEFRACRCDAAEFWAAADWRAIYDKSGGYRGIRISIRDISKRKEAETQLESTVVELKDSQTV